ncbi:MAG: ATP-binding cassette domain-containing protein [Candidatus Nanopelagicales bacterium]
MSGSDAGAGPVLAARALTKSYPPGRGLGRRRQPGPAVSSLSLELRSGEVCGLVGEKGAGKSTAGALLAGRLEPTSGTLRLQDLDIALAGRRERRALLGSVGFVATDAPGADRRATVGELLGAAVASAGSNWAATGRTASGPAGPDEPGPDELGTDELGPDELGPDEPSTHGTGTDRTGSHERGSEPSAAEAPSVADLMGALGLPDELMGARVRKLSAAEQYLVQVVAAVAGQPRLVICDEPPEGLAADQRSRVTRLLRSVSRTGAAVVLLTSDIDEAAQSCDLVGVLFQGRIVELLTPDELRTRSLHPYTQALLAEAGSPRAGSTRGDSGATGPEAGRPVPGGCAYRPWCFRAKPQCAEDEPQLATPLGAAHRVACHLPELPAARPGAGGPGPRPAGSSTTPGSREPTGRDFAQG